MFRCTNVRFCKNILGLGANTVPDSEQNRILFRLEHIQLTDCAEHRAENLSGGF